VHCLLHLTNDVKNLGCLEDFSAFIFENKLGHLKKLVHKPQQPLQQIMRRLHEESLHAARENNVFLEPILMCEHYNGPLLLRFQAAWQYRRIQTDKFTVGITAGNNCVLLDGCMPALVRNIVKLGKQIVLICAKFASVCAAFEYPLSSLQLNICRVTSVCEDLFTMTLEDVVCKCVCWPPFSHDSVTPADDTFLVLPLLH